MTTTNEALTETFSTIGEIALIAAFLVILGFICKLIAICFTFGWRIL